jgi:hypothetical protein
MITRWQAAAVLAALLCGAAEATAQTCTGNCGTLGANGVVDAPPGGGDYRWVSTNLGDPSVALPSVGGTQEGSRFRTSAFSASGGDQLQFYFNYVTTDGSQYADYAWVRLLNSDLTEAAVLFTARTSPTYATVPGFDMPDIHADVTLGSYTYTHGAPTWAPLGSDSGRCFQGTGQGCGWTGWISAMFDFGNLVGAGNYVLEFGVKNWTDNSFDSGLAWSGTQIAGNPIDPTVVPEPLTLLLLGTGLAGIGAVQRRRRRETDLV